MPTRTARVLATLTLTAAALTGAVAAATPALAAPNVSVKTFPIAGGTALSMLGSDRSDTIVFSGSGGTVTVAGVGSSVAVAGNCSTSGVDAGTRVTCTGITLIEAFGSGGSDDIDNDTAIPMGVNGGLGDDKLFGGPGRDTLNGGPGFDSGNGSSGRDTCGVENPTSCEVLT